MATFEEKWAEWKATIEKYKPEWKKEFLNWANDHGYGFNGGFFNEFPHTHYYETDLSWLIARMKWALSRIDNVEERMSAVEELLINFVESLNIDELIREHLKEMIENGAFSDIVNELIGAPQIVFEMEEIPLNDLTINGTPSNFTPYKAFLTLRKNLTTATAVLTLRESGQTTTKNNLQFPNNTGLRVEIPANTTNTYLGQIAGRLSLKYRDEYSNSIYSGMSCGAQFSQSDAGGKRFIRAFILRPTVYRDNSFPYTHYLGGPVATGEIGGLNISVTWYHNND